MSSSRYGRVRRAAATAARAVFLAVLVICALPLLDRPLRGMRVVLQRPPLNLPIPVSGVSAAALRDSWGAPRSGGRRHQGIDIFARRGTPVLATTPGIVWRAGQNRLGGHVVWVLGPGGHLHYYAHLDQAAAVAPGSLVAAGDVLGTVGNSGNARGGPHHLHYGIYVPARGAINPFPMLSAGREIFTTEARRHGDVRAGRRDRAVPQTHNNKPG